MSKAETPSTVVYREKLLPSPTVWIVTLLLSVMSGLIVYPVWATGLFVVFPAVLVVAVVALWINSPVIMVTADTFYAGAAHIDRDFLSEARPYGKEESFAARGPRLDARAHLVLRPWVKQTVEVVLDDPADPTPYWLVSTRHPGQLARALAPASA